MSDRNEQARVGASADAGMVVGGKADVYPRGSGKKRAAVRLASLAALIVLLIVLLVTVYVMRHRRNSAEPASSTSSDTSPTIDLHGQNVNTEAKYQTVQTDVHQLDNLGKYSQAQQLLNNSLKQTSGAANKAGLYNLLSSLAYDHAQYQQSLQYAQQAESLDPTGTSARFVAQSAEKLGDNATAVKYYKLLLDRLEKPIYPSEQAQIEQKIQELGG